MDAPQASSTPLEPYSSPLLEPGTRQESFLSGERRLGRLSIIGKGTALAAGGLRRGISWIGQRFHDHQHQQDHQQDDQQDVQQDHQQDGQLARPVSSNLVSADALAVSLANAPAAICGSSIDEGQGSQGSSTRICCEGMEWGAQEPLAPILTPTIQAADSDRDGVMPQPVVPLPAGSVRHHPTGFPRLADSAEQQQQQQQQQQQGSVENTAYEKMDGVLSCEAGSHPGIYGDSDDDTEGPGGEGWSEDATEDLDDLVGFGVPGS